MTPRQLTETERYLTRYLIRLRHMDARSANRYARRIIADPMRNPYDRSMLALATSIARM